MLVVEKFNAFTNRYLPDLPVLAISANAADHLQIWA
jgi:hypothetical protein